MLFYYRPPSITDVSETESKMFTVNLLYAVLICHLFPEIYCQMNKMKFFRKDYVSLDRTDGFYKMHPERKSWQAAKGICDAEGASLFYPIDENETNIVLQHFKNKYTIDRIFIGISTPYSRDIFETLDGKLVSEVYDKWYPGQPDNYNGNDECIAMDGDGFLHDFAYGDWLPFICKKTENTIKWNLVCDLPDPAYEYVKELGRCYKLHLTPKKWSDAYAVCRLEQSYLAIVNSHEEAKYLSQLMNRATPYNEIQYSGAIHLGFKRTNSWRTIQGQPLRESGYANWEKTQPGSESRCCGAMSNSTLLNDVDCEERAIFICEHEIELLKFSLDERYG